MTRITVRTLLLACMVFLAACKPANTTPPPEPVQELPVTMTVPQRSTTAVPGSSGTLFLRTGDVTMGQVTVAMVDARDAILMPMHSLYVGDTHDFGHAGVPLRLRLDHLANALIGQDYATFTVTRQTAETGDRNEAAQIEALLNAIAALHHAEFLRNGQTHTPKEAVAHLRGKWESAGTDLSAREFIERIASRSSTTGEPYLIRYADGRTEPLRNFLLARLQRRD